MEIEKGIGEVIGTVKYYYLKQSDVLCRDDEYQFCSFSKPWVPIPKTWVGDKKNKRFGHRCHVRRRVKCRDNRPKIITLCGSSRFIETFAVMAYLLEKEGFIVLGLHYLPPGYFEGRETVPDHIAEDEGVAEHFDNLHLRKIDISDSIYVLNVGGYIGKSTKREIDYAKKIDKPVSYLEL